MTALCPAEGMTMTEGGNNWWYFWSHWKGYPYCTVSAGCPAAGTTIWALHFNNRVWGSVRWDHSFNMKEIGWVVVEKKTVKESTNQRLAFSGKSLEHDGTLMRSEGRLGELTVPIWKQYDEWLQRRRPGKYQPIRGQHSAENHWSVMICNRLLYPT